MRMERKEAIEIAERELEGYISCPEIKNNLADKITRIKELEKMIEKFKILRKKDDIVRSNINMNVAELQQKLDRVQAISELEIDEIIETKFAKWRIPALAKAIKQKIQEVVGGK